MKIKHRAPKMEAVQVADPGTFAPPAEWPQIEQRGESARSQLQRDGSSLFAFTVQGPIPVKAGDWLVIIRGHMAVMDDSSFRQNFEEDKP